MSDPPTSKIPEHPPPKNRAREMESHKAVFLETKWGNRLNLISKEEN